jgi:hypothetical protein
MTVSLFFVRSRLIRTSFSVAGVYGGCFGVSIDILHLFLRRKAGDGDAIGGGMWIGGRSFEKSSHLLVEPLGKMAFLSTIWGHNRGAHCHLKAAALRSPTEPFVTLA